MKKFERCHDLITWVSECKHTGNTIGFVPTMGALHDGHLALVKRSLEENDFTVCSVFVNPTQFNDPKDLDAYPRTLEKDSTMLLETGVHVLFCPDVREIYPEGLQTSLEYELDGLDNVMEGEHRPGHFQGVVRVVKRLLELVSPDRLYMGQKDFQQFTIIGHMIKKWKLPVELVVCPTVREFNGLAMSSRNQRLSDHMKSKAALIYKVLMEVKRRFIQQESSSELEDFAKSTFAIEGFQVEYFSIVDGANLKHVEHISQTNYAVACTALWAEGVRLIDNEIIYGKL
jgi:pantoate--beta-alanine ligase